VIYIGIGADGDAHRWRMAFVKVAAVSPTNPVYRARGSQYQTRTSLPRSIRGCQSQGIECDWFGECADNKVRCGRIDPKYETLRHRKNVV